MIKNEDPLLDTLKEGVDQFFGEKPQRFYFIHIPKTGGTSLHALLEVQFDLHDIYPLRELETVNPPIDHQLVSGHFPYWFCNQNDKEFKQAFKVTVLRDPIERYLSLLRYRKKCSPIMRKHDLEWVYNNIDSILLPSYQRGENRLCHFLASDPNLKGRALLESAKKSLDSFDVVLFLENFESDMLKLFKIIGIESLYEVVPHLNTTIPEKISPEFLEKIKKDNDLDFELYEYAKTHLKPKKTSYRFPSHRLFSDKIKEIDYQFHMPFHGESWHRRENVDRFSPEYPIYRWVMDNRALIYFNLEENIDYQLQFYARPLHQDIQDVFPHLSVNGVEILVEKRSDAEFSEYYCVIPKELISNKSTELTFFSLNSYKFNEIYPGCEDDRKLCFALNRIKISPCGSDGKL